LTAAKAALESFSPTTPAMPHMVRVPFFAFRLTSL
jgi:hypothetical protein